MTACSQTNCFADDYISCDQGHLSLKQCPYWNSTATSVAVVPADVDEMYLPWNGMAMGEHDLSFISGRIKPITVGMVGPESAGKTTILAAFYLLLGRGVLTDVGSPTFCGSYTLSGWEAVANSLRWKPGQPPRFPAHTPSGTARGPGMLHLGFRRPDGMLRDLVFADAPGEWFQKWAVNEQAGDAEGARWIARHADVTLLIADRQALAGKTKGTARNDFQLLTQRALAGARGRRVALVWTKGDVELAPAMETQIRSAVMTRAKDAPEFTVSVHGDGSRSAEDGFRELFAWLLATTRRPVLLPVTESSTHDPLFRFGRR